MDRVLGAFTSEQAARLSGLSKRQVEYWDTTHIYSPSLSRLSRGPYSRIYSFTDLVALRTLAILRERVPPQRLRRIGAWLREHYDQPWSSLRFSLVGDRIDFIDPGSGAIVSTHPSGQEVIDIAYEEVAQDIVARIKHSQRRSDHDIGRVSQHRYVVRNAPVIAGTRVPIAAVWQFHEAGYSESEIIQEYPTLTIDDVRAAITRQSEIEKDQPTRPKSA
ncbi:MAG: DUF433 domain-containing protein [Chloroflexota bacterium]|nr:DUF433 domain-containing protein [Chloroflexota bacterium]